MVAAALLYKVKSWLTGSYFSEFSCRSSLFLGLVVMNCSNSIAIDLMSSVCMTAVGFPFFGGPLPALLAILQLSDFLSRSAPSSSIPRSVVLVKRQNEASQKYWSASADCYSILHFIVRPVAPAERRSLPCVRCDEAGLSVSPPEMFHCNSLKRRSR